MKPSRPKRKQETLRIAAETPKGHGSLNLAQNHGPLLRGVMIGVRILLNLFLGVSISWNEVERGVPNEASGSRNDDADAQLPQEVRRGSTRGAKLGWASSSRICSLRLRGATGIRVAADP
jgi:hypothetical protein